MSLLEQRHRLKQKDLVALLFVLFSEEYDRTEVDSIIDIELPMNTVRDYLEKHVGIRYTSDTWIATQIHKYESEIGTKLFRKHDSETGPMLGLNRDIRTYSQKQHLYVTQKIRVANGVMDLIRNERDGAIRDEPISLLLGAGSTVTRVAELIAESLPELPWKWRIATHNLGVIEVLGKTSPGFERVEISIPEGHFDPTTYLILGKNETLYKRMTFDWIIQGASFMSKGLLYVERDDETRVKSLMLRECKGGKILVLTGHETAARAPALSESFGAITEYDYIVLPALPPLSPTARRLAAEMEPCADRLPVWIRNWSYEIIRVRH